MAAAAGVMFERGVTRTSLEDVRHAAGVSNSQLYHYFVDKAALVRGVVGYQSEQELAGQQPLLSSLECDHLTWPRLGGFSSRISAPPGW